MKMFRSQTDIAYDANSFIKNYPSNRKLCYGAFRVKLLSLADVADTSLLQMCLQLLCMIQRIHQILVSHDEIAVTTNPPLVAIHSPVKYGVYSKGCACQSFIYIK